MIEKRPENSQSPLAGERSDALSVNSTLQHDQPGKHLPLSLFVKAVEQAPVAISITDKKANILYVNKAFVDVTGYPSNEIIGKNESKLSDKSTPRQVYYELWHTISCKLIWHGSVVNRRKQGQRYLADLTIAPMLDEQGAISHYIGMHQDVSKAHKAMQQLGNQKQLSESVINASPIAMVVLDSDKRIILDNQLYKMLISELGHSEPALFFLDALRSEMGDIYELKLNFSHREVRVDGSAHQPTRWFSCSANWFNEEDTCADSFFSKQSKNYMLLTIHDISVQRRQQEKAYLQTLRDTLINEEHLQSVRETVLGMMHQMSQPLNQIGAAIQIMEQNEACQNQALKALLNQIQSMGEETLATLQRCLPQLPQSSVIPVNINQIVHEVILLSTQKFLANGVMIDWLPDSILPSVLGSENKLRMLFKQLIDNAVNAMNRGGSLHERIIKIATKADQDWVCVMIADTGPGISIQQHSKVFEPFFSTQVVGSTQVGMGLVMVKEIIHQHKGMIAIDPDYKEGCCFNLKFPVCSRSSL